MRRLIELVDLPLPSTSANRTGQPPPLTLEAVADFDAYGEVLALDGGPLENIKPSTVVDCTGDKVQLVREGPVSRGEIEALIGYTIA